MIPVVVLAKEENDQQQRYWMAGWSHLAAGTVVGLPKMARGIKV